MHTEEVEPIATLQTYQHPPDREQEATCPIRLVGKRWLEAKGPGFCFQICLTHCDREEVPLCSGYLLCGMGIILATRTFLKGCHENAGGNA